VAIQFRFHSYLASQISLKKPGFLSWLVRLAGEQKISLLTPRKGLHSKDVGRPQIIEIKNS
jgi:hypothetical protein